MSCVSLLSCFLLLFLSYAGQKKKKKKKKKKRDADGNLLRDRARLDLRLEGGPEEPTTYGDVVVSQARADSWVRGPVFRRRLADPGVGRQIGRAHV